MSGAAAVSIDDSEVPINDSVTGADQEAVEAAFLADDGFAEAGVSGNVGAWEHGAGEEWMEDAGAEAELEAAARELALPLPPSLQPRSYPGKRTCDEMEDVSEGGPDDTAIPTPVDTQTHKLRQFCKSKETDFE